MEVREGVVVVVWKEINNAARFAVLRRDLNWEGWEFVKGAVDSVEEKEEAAKREVKEETGIEDIIEVEDLNRMHKWRYKRDGKKIEAQYRVFLAKVPEGANINVSANPHDEHSKGFFLNPRDTKDILTHENQKKLVGIALEIIEEEYTEK